MQLNYDDIFLFIKLVKVGSYSGLAKSLHTTQATISRRIQNLEENLHLQLIRRNQRGLFKMTPDGEILYAKFSEQEKILGSALREVIDRQNVVRGTLRIAIPLLLYNKVLAPHIHIFQEDYPDAKLIISYAAGSVDLLKDNFDLAVSTSLPVSQTNTIKWLNSYHYRLYATNEYILKYGKPNTPEELIQHKLIGSSINTVEKYLVIGQSPDNLIDKHLEATNINTNKTSIIDYNPSICISNAFANIDMVYNNNYIVKALDLFMNNDLANGKVQLILPEYTFGSSKFYLIRNNGIRSKLEQAFVEFIKESFAKCTNI